MTTTQNVNIPVAAIDVNDWNGPREADEELTASVKERGILQPVCAMPVNGGRYLLVYGARRVDAAKKAGLETIPAALLPEDTPETELRVLNLLENIQREDQDPIQEGRIFAGLVKLGKSTSEIAGHVHKSVGYVHSRLALTGLCPQAQEFIEENGSYSVEAVAMLAKLTPERQVEIIEGNPHYADSPQDMRYAIRQVGRLDGAEFDPTDDALLPEAGPCSQCPKRTGADKLLFDEEDWSGDTCLDEECFAKKIEAHAGREIARIRKKNPDASCVVKPYSYDYADETNKALFDRHDAKPLKDWRVAYGKDDKKNPDAKTAILLGKNGKVEKVTLIPSARPKDGRANKPKTAEEKAEFLEKRRMAWISGQVRGIVQTPREEKPLCDKKTAATWLKHLAEAIAGEDMTLEKASLYLFRQLSRNLAEGLYVDTISAIDVAQRGDKCLRVLRVFNAETKAETAFDALKAKSAEQI